jgi:hypothetical protein
LFLPYFSNPGIAGLTIEDNNLVPSFVDFFAGQNRSWRQLEDDFFQYTVQTTIGELNQKIRFKMFLDCHF